MVEKGMRFNYGAQFAIFFALLGFGFIISSIITVVIGLQAVNGGFAEVMKNPEALQSALLKPENANYAQAAQIVGTFFMMFVPSALFIFICYRNKLWAGFSKHFNLKQIALGFLIMLMANYMAGPFEDISKKLLANFPAVNASAMAAEDLYMQAVKSMSNLKGWGQFIVAIFVVAFFPAVFEEMLFRGVLQNLLTKATKQAILSIIIASVLFSLIHGSYYLFISRFILGLALGFVFFYTKNIWVPIIAHFINNLIALSVLFYSNMQGKDFMVNEQEMKLPIWSIFITGAILYGLFVLLIKTSKENRNRIALKENLAFSNEPFIAEQ